MITVVTTYTNPDLDGFACVVAYADLLNQQHEKVAPIIFGQLDPETDHVLYQTKLTRPDEVAVSPEDKIILVDASKVSSLPDSIQPNQVVEIIDHRKMTDIALFPMAKIQIEMVGAAATLIAEKYKRAQIKPSHGIAMLLFGAIASNTLNFQASVTTDRDHGAAQWLKAQYRIPDDLVKNMFVVKSDVAGEKLIERLRSDRLVAHNGNKLVGISQLEILEAQAIAEERKKEICESMQLLQNKEQSDYSFASLIDLTRGTTAFITDDDELQQILEHIFSVTFRHNLAVYNSFIMRKEIGPKLMEYFTHESP